MRGAWHTKGDAAGIKAERSNHRVFSRRRFAVIFRLFGALNPCAGDDDMAHEKRSPSTTIKDN